MELFGSEDGRKALTGPKPTQEAIEAVRGHIGKKRGKTGNQSVLDPCQHHNPTASREKQRVNTSSAPDAKKETTPTNTTQPTPTNPLTPWWDKPGHNQPGEEIPPPHDHCVSLSTTGWHPDMTGHPATITHGHKPRLATIRLPCPFTPHIGVQTMDTHRHLYLAPEHIFIHETSQ